MENLYFAEFPKDVTMIYQEHIFKNIFYVSFLNIYSKRYFLKVPHIYSALNVRFFDQKRKM